MVYFYVMGIEAFQIRFQPRLRSFFLLLLADAPKRTPLGASAFAMHAVVVVVVPLLLLLYWLLLLFYYYSRRTGARWPLLAAVLCSSSFP